MRAAGQAALRVVGGGGGAHPSRCNLRNSINIATSPSSHQQPPALILDRIR